MIYITIILVNIIAAGLVLGYKYMDYRFNHNLDKQMDLTNTTRIINNTLEKCHKYDVTTGNDKYQYGISQQEIVRIMNDIAYSLNIQLKNYE